MKKGSILVLKSVIWLIGLVVGTICIFGLPKLILAELKGDFDYGVIFIGLYIPAIPFFLALRQALNLLSYIDNSEIFSNKSVKTLNIIKYCGLIISGLFTAGMPYIFYIADKDDAPGVAAAGFVIIGASFVIGTAAAVFERLLQNAVDIKSENDLTV